MTAQRLSEILNEGMPRLNPPQLVDPDTVSRACERIAARWPDARPALKPQDARSLCETIAHRVSTGEWSGIKTSEVARCLRAALSDELRDVAEFAALRQFLWRELAATTRPNLLRAARDAMLETYQAEATHTQQLATLLKDRKEQLTERCRRLLRAVPEVLDPTDGARRFGYRMAEAQDPFRCADDAELPTSGPGFIAAAESAFVEALTPKLQDQDSAALKRLTGWFSPDNPQRRKVVGAAAAIEAVLSPWLERDPPEAWLALCRDSLPEAFGDPRLPGEREAWKEVREPTSRVMQRWLAGASLRFFFEAIELGVAHKPDALRMWDNRKKFWLDLFENKKIDEAWVALSQGAKRAAKPILDQSKTPHGRQVQKVNGEEKSIVIMRIGTKTVVEGSDNFQVHIFKSRAAEAPGLYEQEYYADNIRLSVPENATMSSNGAEKIRHSIGDAWEKKVMRLLF